VERRERWRATFVLFLLQAKGKETLERIRHLSTFFPVSPFVLVDLLLLLPLLQHDIGAALRHYDRARRWRLRFYQMNSRLLTPFFQSNSKLLGWARDVFFPGMCQFAPSRQFMLMVLCGALRNGVPWVTIPKEEFMGFARAQQQ
jgi:hypothetical protein